MSNRLLFISSLSVLVFGFTVGTTLVAQNKERPKLKDFGSSLKRMKWDEEKKAAIEVKPKSSRQSNADEADVVKVETSLVVSDVLVLDARGKPVSGLTEKDFVISEDGKPQQVGALSLSDPVKVPRSIVLIIDHSCSQLPLIEASVVAAQLMIDKLSRSDRMAIVTDDIELLTDFTSDKQRLKLKLGELLARTSRGPLLTRFERYAAPLGRGFQYSALMAVLKEAFSEEDERPIIIFQTDGAEAPLLRNPIVSYTVEPGLPPDLRAQREWNLKRFDRFRKRNPREFGLDDIYKATEKSRATIYTVVPGLRFVGLKPEERAPQMRAFINRGIAGLESYGGGAAFRDYLKRVPDETLAFQAEVLTKEQSALAVLSTISGGWIEFFDQPSQADEIYSRIFADIDRRYVVGYYPTNKTHDGKRRKVNITVRDHPEYTVMGHKGYYAPGPD